MELPLYGLIPIICVGLFLLFVLYLGFAEIQKSKYKREIVIVEPLPEYEIRPPPYEYSIDPPIYVVVCDGCE